MSLLAPHKKLALVMGVANQRSIAWACAQALLHRNYDCILTCHERFTANVQKLMDTYQQTSTAEATQGRILGAVACNVQDEVPKLFEKEVPRILEEANGITAQNDEVMPLHRKLDSIVHSVAYCDMQDPRFSQAGWPVYAQAQHISAYSFLQVAHCAIENNLVHARNAAQHDFSDPEWRPSTLIALTYLGATRAVPNYQCMSPAKAALEAIVRGLAAEYGPTHGLHVNAVSAGPISTLSARGIADFGLLQKHVHDTSPLRRLVTAHEVAEAVAFLSQATGLTGQTLHVDAGYSSVVPVLTRR